MCPPFIIHEKEKLDKYIINILPKNEILHVLMIFMEWTDFGTLAHWVRCVLGALGHHPYHWHRYQPCTKSRCCHHLQQRPWLGWSRMLISFSLNFRNQVSEVMHSSNLFAFFVAQWIFWVGPFVGAALAALYHQVVIRAIPFKSNWWDKSLWSLGKRPKPSKVCGLVLFCYLLFSFLLFLNLVICM